MLRSPGAVATALLVVALAAHAPVRAGGRGAQVSGRDAPVVAWARAADWDTFGDDVPVVALDTTRDDVPALAALLATGTDPQRAAASLALAYGGGDAAIDALRASTRTEAASMLPLALAGRGTAADRAALIKGLDGEHFGRKWPPIVASALALGMLRASEAVPALERAATDDGSSAADAAREAIGWIRQGSWNVDALPAASDEDQIIAAALRNGIPGTAHATLFDDDDRGGAWIRDGDAWRYRAGGRAADATHLGFTVRFNARRNRAILGISLVCGPLCGVGYDYLFTREAHGWTLRGVHHTWIS